MATKLMAIRSSPGVCTEIEAEVIRAPAITSPRCSAPDVLSVSRAVRSVMACEFLSSQGFGDLRNLRGGMAQWIGIGLPVET